MDNWLALFDGQTRYTLEITDSPVTPDVLRFRGREALSEPFSWTIDFTTPQADITPEQMLHRYIESTSGLTAVIASSRSGGALAVQLSAACTIISPNGAAALVRFYIRNVMSLLASRNDREWHSMLFRGVSQWWVPEENGWHPVDIPPSLVINARDSAIRLNKEEWHYIADEPVVTSVLKAWQKLPSSQNFAPCVQRNMVKKALNKACEAKMKAGTEQKLYALFYLNGGKKILASGTMQSALENVALGKVSLEQVLKNNV